ncbi:MAG: Sec-independent protein translocase subunit TatA/TatB [Cuniculiplasma sp.]
MIDSLWEWLIVGVVILALFGSAKKIPDFARNLGRATGEFKRGQTEIQQEIKKSLTEPNTVPNPENEKVVSLAQSMGIDTAGKDATKIKSELAEKLKSDN